MGVLNGREKRVLALAAVFFVSGLAFFVMRMVPQGADAPAPTAVSGEEEPALLLHLPAPSGYDTFRYEKEMGSYAVDLRCEDTFAALLLFEEGVDYRRSPLDAKYNVASRCVKGESAAREIPLATLPLTVGKRYYVVRAQQGERGAWYNPY